MVDARSLAGDHERVRFAEARRHGVYRLGDCHACGTDGSGVRYLSAGWAGPERWGAWSDGPTAQLAFDLVPVPCGALAVHLDVSGYLTAGVARQRVVARVGGAVVGRLELDETQPVAQWTIQVPEGAVRRTLVLDLELPDAISPAAASGEPDFRQIAINLASIRITPDRAPG